MMNMKWPKPYRYELTKYEQQRLMQIRAALERFRAEGEDVSTWESKFFLELIGKILSVKRESPCTKNQR
jgi:hypothetical protein